MNRRSTSLLALSLLLSFAGQTTMAQTPPPPDSLLPYSFGIIYTSQSPINQGIPVDTLPVVAGEGAGHPLLPPRPRDTLARYSVGQISMQESVSPTGARMITIPIEGVPVRGIEPGIALVYSSQSDMGQAGFGWHLSGLSSITIGGKNRHYDGGVTPPDLHSGVNQRFYLDGVRLVANPDSGQSRWADYETATGYVKVRRRQIAAAKIFDAYYPDGTRAVYGLLGESGPVPAIPVISKTDIKGNKLFYEYTRTGNQYVVDRIGYGGETSSSCPAEIRFYYDSLQGPAVRYMDGVAISQNRLLRRVETWHGGALIRAYDLVHEDLSGWPMLIRVRCRNAAGEEMPPLKFSYEGETQSFSVSSTYHGALSSNAPGINDPEMLYQRGKMIPGEYDDGLIIYPNKATWGLIDSNHVGYNYPSDQDIVIVPRFTAPRKNPITIKAGSGFQTMQACDVDGDGTEEMVKINVSLDENGNHDYVRTEIRISSLTATGSWGGTNTVIVEQDGIEDGCGKKYDWFFGDYLGNGKTQLVSVQYNLNCTQLERVRLIDLNAGSILFNQTNLATPWNHNTCYVGAMDFDGDGKTDLWIDTGQQLTIFSYDDSTARFTASHSNIPLAGSILQTAAFGDINADGLIDFVSTPAKSSCAPAYVYIPVWSPAECPYCGYPYPIRGMNETECDNCHSNLFSPQQEHHCRECNALLDSYLRCPTHGMSIEELVPNDVSHDGGYQWTQWINTGTGFELQRTNNYGRRFYRDRGMLYDVDGDGYSELIRFQMGILSFHRNANGNISFNASDTLVVNLASSLVLMNTSSPYASSGLFYLKDHRMYNVTPGQDFRRERLLTRSQDSYGTTRSTQYQDLAEQSNAYSYTYSPAFPYYQALFPMQVVTESSHSVDSVSVSHHRYRYERPVASRDGLGFRGFAHTEDWDFIRSQNTCMDTDPESGCPTGTSSPTGTSAMTWTKVTTRGATENYVNSSSVTNNLLTGVSVTSQRSYDVYGHPTSDLTTWYPGGLTKLTETTYNASLTGSQYFTGKPSYISVTRTRDGESTCSESWINYTNGLPAVCSEAYSYGGVGGNMRETHWTYDSYGNLLTESVKPYNVTTPLTRSYTYDSTGENLLTDTDEMGFTTTYGQYNNYGAPQTVTDHRGRMTTRTYDGWGRQTGETAPDGSQRLDSLLWAGTGLYQHRTHESGSPAGVSDYDALGREKRRGVQRFDGKWQWTETRYNGYGLVSSVSLPYCEGSPRWKTYGYDIYERPVSERLAPDTLRTWSYSGLSTTETREGISSTKTVDARGNLVSAADDGGTITYTLRADDQPWSVSVTGGGQTVFEYDNLGRRKAITDPSAGTRRDSVVYATNGTMTVYHQNPKGAVTSYYDRYGRLTHVDRIGAYHTYYSYDTNGLLTTVYSTNVASKNYTYDAYDRVTRVIDRADGSHSLQTDYVYGADGTLASVSYTSSLSGPVTTENYTYSYGWRTRSALPDGTTVWEITGKNDMGQTTAVTTGTVSRTYGYSSEGLPTFRRMNGGTLQNATYVFEPSTGNLLMRSDGVHNTSESFTYDGLNRLSSCGNNQTTYYDNGNINNKPGLGTFKYNNTGHPYQVSSIDLALLASVSTDPQIISYTGFDRPLSISQSGKEATFTYNGSNDRVKMTLERNDTLILTRYYLGGMYEADERFGNTKEKLYLGGDYYSAPVVYVKDGNTGWTLYNLGRDYQGSVTHVATSSGVLVAEYSYDPWGRMRNPQTLIVYGAGASPETFTGRGYTGHEHLPDFDLVNMNARLYDPIQGRFLSPDPYVQAPDFTQNFNRYSYALNNPLKYTDQSGELAWFVPVIVGAVVGAYLGASYQSETVDFRNWTTDSWKGAICGAIIGGAAGYLLGAGLGASGIISEGSVSQAAGITSSMLFDGSTNIVVDAISGGSWDSAWKSGIAGLAAGGWAASGGLGMVKAFGSQSKLLKLSGKLGYQMIGSSIQSIGSNWSRGIPLFSQLDIGIGPVTLSFGSGPLFQWKKNLPSLIMNGVGLYNMAFFGKAKWDWENLTMEYYGGLEDALFRYPAGFGAYGVLGTSELFKYIEGMGGSILGHELHHLWQSRALGNNFLPDYALHGVAALLMGANPLKEANYFESIAYDYRWFK